MDIKGEPVMVATRSRWSRARSALRGWPGLFLVPVTAVAVAVLGARTGAVWAPLVTTIFGALSIYQALVLLLAVVTEPGPVARRWFYVRVRKILSAITLAAALLVMLGYAITDPAGSHVPILWLLIAVFAIATAVDVRAAWRAWDTASS